MAQNTDIKRIEEKVDAIMSFLVAFHGEMMDFKRDVTARLDKIEHRLDKVEQRLDKVEQRLDTLEKTSVTKERFKLLETQLIAIGFDLKDEIKAVRRRLESIALDSSEAKTEALRIKIEVIELEKRVAALESR